MKKIAVITPVLNGEKFLNDCLKSVALSITNGNFLIEHIVVDDGSTDNSWKIIQDNKSPYLKSLRLKKNTGSSTARNLAVKQTDAEFLFCLDADDVIFQNSLHSLFEYTNDRKTEWIYGDFLRTNKELSYTLGQDYYGHQFNDPNDLLTAIFLGEHFFQQNCLYSRQIFNSVHGFNESTNIAEDLDLFVRFALKGYFPKYLPAPLYLHRFHEHNLSKILGRENNPKVHKNDIKSLYKKYNVSLKSVLTTKQLEKIENFLSKS